MIFFQQFYLDREKDIAVDLHIEEDRLFYTIRTPNHHTGNLITNLAKLCGLETSEDAQGLKVIRDEIPCYFDGDNRKMYILRLGNTKIANIYPDGKVELKASIPAISKTLMSQTRDYRLGVAKTIVKTYIRSECKFRTDLHTHMNGNLPPDALIALGIVRQIRYPYYYIKKLGLRCDLSQTAKLEKRRAAAEAELGETELTGKHRDRRIDDRTFINFAELILGNPADAQYNIDRIRNSLTIPKDGQAVFADLEKVYLYRYVFTKGREAEDLFSGINLALVPDREVRAYAEQMLRDRETERYRGNTLYQDLLLWIAREYRRRGIEYAEISDTALLNRSEFAGKLRQIHEIMPAVTRETGVLIRFLAGVRRIPLTIIRDRITPNDYLADNLQILRAIAGDPYVAGCDIIGEEINNILELRAVIRELVRIAGENPGFVIRIHAGENDSLRDNVANSIACVADALEEGQEIPPLRIGHGLYTCDLRSAKGKKLLEDMRRYRVTLEFQITSNVRLNNLSSLEHHPLRQYLRAGIACVQGTDGGALYGTDSIDEELSLEKLLGLSFEELKKMRESDARIHTEAKKVFGERLEAFRSGKGSGDPEAWYLNRLEHTERIRKDLWKESGRLDAWEELKESIAPLPEGLMPVVIAGGSFNHSGHRTQVRGEDRRLIDRLLEEADPAKTFFVIGHTLSGQEGYLAERNRGKFRIAAIVPNRISRAEKKRLQNAGVTVRISIESTGLGLYKSFAYEIFRRMPSRLLVFDGNAPAMNLIQEARNGREKCAIYVSPRSRGLTAKARMLEGYVTPLDPDDPEKILEGCR
uniref:adenosine deaminase n=1 Tax=uncultured bacterium Contig87 TaxID=1393621 RepID=W0FQR4_9BACT|nr:adenosine/AMP deaminase [uncultured bacterium Contig87]